MSPVPRFDPEELLGHERFVRELARRLVADVHTADDVVQDTFAAVLQAPARPLHSLRAWLATITRRTAERRARTERRRRRREDRAAADRPAPSVDELVAREQARAAVVRAVLELPRAYRDVVVLRWFEGLPPRDVARRLGVPVATVRTRNRRALDQLRLALDARNGGDRGAWIAVLLPLVAAPHPALPPAPPAATAATTTLLGGAFLMSTKLQVGAVAAVAIAFACWSLIPSAPPRAPEAAPAASPRAAAATAELAPAGHGAEAIALPQREAAAPTIPAPTAPVTTGSVAVTVLWSDRTPAPGVQVLLGGGPVRRMIASDGDGIARFDELPPGPYLTNVERGALFDVQQQRVELAAGAELAVELVLADGLDLQGIVVDGGGRGIPGASIVVAPIGSGPSAIVARSAADGRFSARDVPVDCCVGAEAAGLAPSMLRQMTGSVGGEVELRLVLDAPGAVVTGTVLAPDGRPVPGARVHLRPPTPDYVRLPDGSRGRRPNTETRFTDEHGRFVCAPLLPAPHRVLVVTDAFAPWGDEVTPTADASTDVVVRLQAGATFRGVVRDGGGRPIARASVTAFAESDMSRSVASNPDGTFDLRGAPVGEVLLRARSRDGATLTQKFEASSGQVVVWDPVLPTAATLRGRAVDHEGQPVAGANVSASLTDDGSGGWEAYARTDDDGRFHLDNCEPGVPIVVTARRGPFDVAKRVGVLPGDDELRVAFPPPTSVRMRGSVLDDRGAPLPNVEIIVLRGRSSARERNEPDTGSFALGPYPDGEYRLILRTAGFAPLRVPARALADGETWDVGELRLQRGGTLRATFVGSGTFADRYVEITFADGRYAWGEDSAGGAVVVGPLAAGDYRMHVRGEDVVCQIVPFTIRDGRDTVLDVPLPAGTATTLTFAAPVGVPLPHGLEVTIADAATGAQRFRNTIWDQGGLTLRTMLPPGRYHIDASGTNELQQPLVGSRDLDVGAPAVAESLLLRKRD